MEANPDMSVLELLDVLNEELIEKGEDPVAFEHDCREGICGSCGFMINGIAHGPLPATTVCQLTMRHFKDGEELTLEPWRARPFPVIKDLVVDRRSSTALLLRAAISRFLPEALPTGTRFSFRRKQPTGPWTQRHVSLAALVSRPVRMPQLLCSLERRSLTSEFCRRGKPERDMRAIRMVTQMNEEGFGGCTNIGECTGVCPKEIPLEVIAAMNRDYLRGSWRERDNVVTPLKPFTEWSTDRSFRSTRPIRTVRSSESVAQSATVIVGRCRALLHSRGLSLSGQAL